MATSDAAKELTRAQEALGRDAKGEALAALLAAWSALPAARIAALVEQVSASIDQALPPIAGKTAKARLAAGLEAVTAGDARDLPRILRLLRDLRVDDAVALLEALEAEAAFARDPRLLEAVMGLVRDPPYHSSPSHKMWRRLFRLLAATGDARAPAALEAHDFLAAVGNEWGAEALRGLATRALANVVKQYPDGPPPLPADAAALCDALEGALSARGASGDELLARVRENPRDLDARAVYGDWLAERGDPRGELIALQLGARDRPLTDAEARRERALLDAHATDWLGRLAPVIVRDRVRFAGGFPHELAVDLDLVSPLGGEPLWATVERLWLIGRRLDAGEAGPPLPRALLADPVMRGLRFVGGLSVRQLGELVRDPLPLEGVGADAPRDREFTSDEREAIEALDAIPTLTELALDDYYSPAGAYRWVLATAIGRRIRRLSATTRLGSIIDWREQLAEAADPLEELTVSFNQGWHAWSATLRRDRDRAWSRLHAVLRPSLPTHQTSKLEDLVATLDKLPEDALTELTVEARGVRVTKAATQALATAARRQKRLGRLALPGQPA